MSNLIGIIMACMYTQRKKSREADINFMSDYCLLCVGRV